MITDRQIAVALAKCYARQAVRAVRAHGGFSGLQVRQIQAEVERQATAAFVGIGGKGRGKKADSKRATTVAAQAVVGYLVGQNVEEVSLRGGAVFGCCAMGDDAVRGLVANSGKLYTAGDPIFHDHDLRSAIRDVADALNFDEKITDSRLRQLVRERLDLREQRAVADSLLRALQPDDDDDLDDEPADLGRSRSRVRIGKGQRCSCNNGSCRR